MDTISILASSLTLLWIPFFIEGIKDECTPLSTLDFQDVIKKDTFVDKTFFIKTLFEGPPVKWITAPRNFGKTTNLNMMKHFLEIQVDESGKPHSDKKNTSNYRLFKENNLKIMSDDSFIELHFGKHPVIYIDYKPIRGVNSYAHLLRQFTKVLKNSFFHHTYLLRVSHLWVDDLNNMTFKKYIDSELSLKLTKMDLEEGFMFLCTVLHRHFGKKVIVLIDNYDSFVEGLIFKSNLDIDYIIFFIQSIHEELLKFNQFLERALLTGVFSLGSSRLPRPLKSVAVYIFLGNHPFGKYYGLTEKELDNILKKVTTNNFERDQSKRAIVEYYGGYNTTQLKICNMGSVQMFLENKRLMFCYLCKSEYFDSFRSIFKVDKIVENIQNLLQGDIVYGDMDRMLTKYDVLALNDIVKYEKTQSDIDIKLFFLFLYQQGYLAPTLGAVLDSGEIPFKIPNKERSHELINVLYESYIDKYHFRETCIQQLYTAVASFQSNPSITSVDFEFFCKTLNDLFRYSSYTPRTEREFISSLYALLSVKYLPGCELNIVTLTEWDSDVPSIILLVNTRQTAIIVETQLRRTKQIQTTKEKQEARENSAQLAHEQAVSKTHSDDVDRTIGLQSVSDKIYVGIGIDMDRQISIAYSYSLKDGGDIKNVQLISPLEK